MKRIALLFSASLLYAGAFSQTLLRDAVANPPAVTALKFSGAKNEAALFTKSASKFYALKSVTLTAVNDSVALEQDLAALAACPAINTVTFEHCGVQHISGVVQMLTGVRKISIRNCDQLDNEQAFAMLAKMPGLAEFEYRAAKISQLPRSLTQLRGLDGISMRNDDISLADGYLLNHSLPSQLYADDSILLGFGDNVLILRYGCYDKTMAKIHLDVMRNILQGTIGESGEMKLPERPKIFTRQNQFVKPPIAGLDVQKSIYTTNAATGGTIAYPSGTKINIPANAFVDANGKPVNGNVTVDYREFRDPVDILASGITMKYDSAGQQNDFQSAGMFDLNASVNGQEVFLAPGKKIDLQFAVTDTAAGYNFYKLDPQQGWQYISQVGQPDNTRNFAQNQNAQVNTFSAAADKFISSLYYIPGKYFPLGDTMQFNNIYEDTGHIYMYRRMDHVAYSNGKSIYNSNWKIKHLPSKRQYYCFLLVHPPATKKYPSYSADPEMNAFRGVAFMFNDKVDKAVLRRLKRSNNGVNDIRISYDGDADFTMQVKCNDGFRSFSVKAVHVRKDTVVAYRDRQCARMAKSYCTTLGHRQKDHDKNVVNTIRGYNAWKLRMTNDSLLAWENSKKLMTAKERNMNFRDWAVYAKKNSRSSYFNTFAQSYASIQQGSAITRALSILSFGIFNCDQIQRIAAPEVVDAVAFSPGGQLRKASEMIVVQKNKNQVFTYNGAPDFPVHIAFDKFALNRMIIVHDDGSVSYVSPSDFIKRQHDGNGNTRFTSTDLSDKPVSTQQLRDLIFPKTDNTDQK